MRRLLAAVALAALAGGGLVAQETRSTTLLTTEHYLDWERVSDAQISPDGSRIVYTRQAVNTLEDKWESSLWILNADGSQHRFLVKGSAARWSPDGKRLLYVADGFGALRPVGGRRRPGNADHARDRDAARREVVA